MKTARAFPDLNNTLDSELIDGSRGVFAGNWNDASQEPSVTGNYLVVVKRSFEPVIGLFIQGQGWHLGDTIHTGLEGLVTWWMEIPRGPR